MSDPTQVLVIASQTRQCKRVVLALDQLGFKVRLAFTLAEAQATLESEHFPVVCSSTELIDGTYRDVLEILLSRSLATRLLVISPRDDNSEYLEAMELGAFDLLPCDCAPSEVERILRNAMACTGPLQHAASA